MGLTFVLIFCVHWHLSSRDPLIQLVYYLTSSHQIPECFAVHEAREIELMEVIVIVLWRSSNLTPYFSGEETKTQRRKVPYYEVTQQGRDSVITGNSGAWRKFSCMCVGGGKRDRVPGTP